MMRSAIFQIEVGIQLAVDPEGGRDAHFVVRDVCAECEVDVVACIGVRAIEIRIRAPHQRQFFGSFYFAHVEQGLADVDPSDSWQYFLGFRQLVGIKLAIQSDFFCLARLSSFLPGAW